MADEIGELDLTAQASAAQQATNYMYFDSTNGLKIASSSPSSATRRVQIKSDGIGVYNDNNNYSYINSNGMNVYKGGSSVAAFGSTARIGKEDDLHMTLLNNGIRLYEKEETSYADSSVAKFTGQESVIGEVKDIHTRVSSDGFSILNGETKLFSIDAEQTMTTHSQDSSWEVKKLVFDKVFGEGTITSSTSGYLVSTNENDEIYNDAGQDNWCWISSSGLKAKPQIFLDMASDTADTQREWVPIEEIVESELAEYEYTEPEAYGIGSDYRFYFRVRVPPSTGSLPVRWKIGIAHYERNLSIQVGKENESHMELDYHSLQLIDKEGDTYFHVSDLRGADGIAELIETFTGDGTSRMFTLSLPISATPTVTVDNVQVPYNASGGFDVLSSIQIQFRSAPSNGSIIVITYQTTSSSAKAFTFGTRKSNSSNGAKSFSEGANNEASGAISHAEGVMTTASGEGAHSEGVSTISSGYGSHAEGRDTTSNGSFAHAEGDGSTASGSAAHAEGGGTIAGGHYSHAQNLGTIAKSNSQTALGKYNVENANSTYALIIGNGTSNSARSNAATIAWNGNYLAQAMAGIIQMFAGPEANIPAGWLLCDGSYVSKTTYPTLYTAIGSTWGQETSTTFALPDFRGRGPMGVMPLTAFSTTYPNLLRQDCVTWMEDQYLVYKLYMSEDMTTSTRYTLQFWDVDVMHTGKSQAANVNVAIYWGGSTIQLFNFQADNTVSAGTATKNSGSASFINETTINGTLYHADYLEIDFTTGTTAGAEANVLHVYNSIPHASGDTYLKIGKWQLTKGSHTGIPWSNGTYKIDTSARNRLGSVGGARSTVLDISHLPRHNHGSGTFRVQQWHTGTSSGIVSQGTNTKDLKSPGSGSTSGSSTFTITTNTQGSNYRHTITQPYATVNFIICTGKTS